MTSPAILTESQIRSLVGPKEALAAVRGGFAKLARGQVTLPDAVGFEVGEERGEVHVKSGYLHGSPCYSIKIASGFYNNPARGLPVGNGLVLVFDAQTGQLRTVLFDNGYLTELRTGAAGGLAAELLSKPDSARVGIIGCGSQARYQLEAIRDVRNIRDVVAYGRSADRARRYAAEVKERFGLTVILARCAQEAVTGADIVVTTTPAHEPIVKAEWISHGALVIAMGSDGPGKQELDPAILADADKIVVDNRKQCLKYGEMQHAASAGVEPDRIYAELGEIAAGMKPGRSSSEELIVVDLTGVGVQDAAVANEVVAKASRLGLLRVVSEVPQ